MKTFLVTQVRYYVQIAFVVNQSRHDTEEEAVKDCFSGKLDDAFVVKITLDDNEVVTNLAVRYLVMHEKPLAREWEEVDEFEFDCFEEPIMEFHDSDPTIYFAAAGDKLDFVSDRVEVVYYYHYHRKRKNLDSSSNANGFKSWWAAWWYGIKFSLRNWREYRFFFKIDSMSFEERSL